MIGLASDRKYQYMTDKQAEYIALLIEARFEVEDPRREELREMFFAIRTNDDVGQMIEHVKTFITLETQTRAHAVAERPTSDGYYRNPETGELWRISHGARNNVIVAKYSTTGGPRRLVTSFDEIVTGKWGKALSKGKARQALAEIKLSWLVDPRTLAQDFAYGFCPLHHGPLEDAVSVILGYGPKCAEREGLPWSREFAQQVLDTRHDRNNES